MKKLSLLEKKERTAAKQKVCAKENKDTLNEEEIYALIGGEKYALIGIKIGLETIFPFDDAAIKGMVKPFIHAVVKRMLTGAKCNSKATATENLFEDAIKAGISIEGMQKGIEPERVKFIEFLEKDATEETK